MFDISENVIGQICAILAALTFSTGLILFRKIGERVPAMSMNLFKNVFVIVPCLVTMTFTQSGFTPFAEFSLHDYGLLVFSGVIGIAIADTLFLIALARLGVGLTTVVDCMYSPSTIFCAWILLGESILFAHIFGACLVITGIVISSFHTPPEGFTRGQMIVGLICGASAAAMMGFGITLVKPLMEDHTWLAAATIRIIAGTVGLTIVIAMSRHRRTIFAVLKPSSDWKMLVPAALLWMYLCTIFWHASFTYTQAAVAGILGQTSAIFSIVLAAIFLREVFTRRKFLSLFLALIGIGFVFWADHKVTAEAAKDQPPPTTLESTR